MSRPSWEEYALTIAYAAAIRSEDPWGKVGACALRHDNTIAGLGYNGALPGKTIDWSDRDGRLKEVIHAELNCLAYCKPGECRLLACTLLPCGECLKTIARYGISTVVYGREYKRDSSSLEMAERFGIKLVQMAVKIRPDQQTEPSSV